MNNHESLPGLSKREIFEGMSRDAIVEHILNLGQKVTEIERDMNLASEVLEGIYGVTVEDVISTDNTTLAIIQGGENKNGEQY